MKNLNDKVLMRVSKTKTFFCVMIIGMLCRAANVSAKTQTDVSDGSTSYSNLKLFTGTQNLLTAGAAAITALIAGLTIIYGLKAVTAWQTASDDEKPRKGKAVIVTIAIGVVGITLAGVVTWVLGFYK